MMISNEQATCIHFVKINCKFVICVRRFVIISFKTVNMNNEITIRFGICDVSGVINVTKWIYDDSRVEASQNIY